MVAGTIAILGAGAMGSALATPLRSAGWNVNLWGTWLDDGLLDACRSGRPHPRTGVDLAEGTRLFRSDQLDVALAGAELTVVAVASAGVLEVVGRGLAGLRGSRALLLTSKGFAPDEQGRVRLLPDALRDLAAEQGTDLPPVVAVGGPCKANEVAAGRWTAAILGCSDLSTAEETVKAVATETYRAHASSDEVGIEICAPMKNVYAIALGIADGLGEGAAVPCHDLKAAVFVQAVRELVVLTRLVGGDQATATGLAGVGDLEVTGLSGRNKVYGSRIGRGEAASAALEAMAANDQTVEGVPAARHARHLVDQRDTSAWSSLPLLTAILDILDGGGAPAGRLADAVLPVG